MRMNAYWISLTTSLTRIDEANRYLLTVLN
jgi:hypothetical protein